MSIPLSTYNYSYQSSLSLGFLRTSYSSILKLHTFDNDQVVKKTLFNDCQSFRKQHPFSSTLNQMHQHTTDESAIGVPSRLCSVCGDISTGIHFGGNSCESCKAFFRRSVQCNRFQNYKCSNDEKCPVNIVTRKVCQFCRYTKCTVIGMKPKWVLSDQEREEKYGARRKRGRENRVTDEDPDIYKYLTKEEKTLIEDIAHALYQSRATYPLNFPNPSALFTNQFNEHPPTPPTANDKPSGAAANFLIVPIQRLVLFARMLKDFDSFSEDDKVSLLKGSAIEIMVCSSATLFNPKTHTFTNYLSRDQRALMDEQVLPLDPLLIKVWGEEIFSRTRNFLISMCNLHIDEVTSTLLVPIILFSPDRLNIQDLGLVKRLQEKYATLLRKYMSWRYGIEQADRTYPRLLLQITSLRSLSLSHGEIIQKFIATTNVNPLVQEITVKPEMFNRPTTERMDSLSISSSPMDSDMLDFDKTPSNETESNIESDDDDSSKKQDRSFDDRLNFDNDDFDETDLHNIWRKRRKTSSTNQLSSMRQTEQNNSNKNQQRTYNDYKNMDKYPTNNCLYMKPFDHQVPAMMPVHHDDTILLTNSGLSTQNQMQQMQKQTLVASHQSIQQLQQLYQANSSPSNDLSSYDYHSTLNSMAYNSTLSPPSEHYYDQSTNETYRQQYPQTPPIQQQQNVQDFSHLSLVNNQRQTPPIQSATSSHYQPSRQLETEKNEQQLLDAIHAHPQKRDLVLNLLRQIEQETSTHRHQQQQQYPSNSSTNTKSYENDSNMKDSDDSS